MTTTTLTLAEYAVPLLAVAAVAVAVVQVRRLLVSGAAAAAPVEEPLQAGEPEEDDRPEAVCFFGSQTGTAEGFAQDLAKDLSKNGFRARALDLEEFDETEFVAKTRFAAFLMATYGEGEPCDNSIEFMGYLRNDAPEDLAKKCKYAVFGLGNTQYEKYNAMGKEVRAAMERLGGHEVVEMGLGDDDEDMEEDFATWREKAVAAFVKEAFGAEVEANPASDEVCEPWKRVGSPRFVPAPEDDALAALGGRVSVAPGSKSKRVALEHTDLVSRHFFQCAFARVVANRELRSARAEGSTRHVELDLSGTGMRYATADNLTVCAENDAAQVDTMGRVLGVDLDQWLVLDSMAFPTPCQVRTALSHFTDLNGAPSRSLLGKLAPFCTLAEHRKRLLFLASKDGKDAFHATVSARRLSVFEVFETFPSFAAGPAEDAEAKIGSLLQVLPRLKGREFTIASSSSVHPECVALTVGVIEEERPQGRLLRGVASTFLKNLDVGAQALVFVKESSFKMPANPAVPILLIGPGTGIAPMRAFIEERQHQLAQHGTVGETTLYFGCRREDHDFLYKDELLAALESGALTRLHTAFSRQVDGTKIYVQDVMRQHADEVWAQLEAGAFVYVCGATRMGKDVHAALVDICKPHVADSKAFVEVMQKNHRYIQELWSS